MGRSGIDEVFRGIGYRPLPSQRRFHLSDARFKGFSGPIGSGKSQALCHEAIRLAYVNAGRMGLIGAPTYPMLRDSTQMALFEILRENKIPYEHNKADNTVQIEDTGSRIVFRPLDDFERLRGTNLAWFGVDELTYTPRQAWLRLEGRLRDPKASRLCGFGVWTPKGFDWVHERFVESRPDGYEVVAAEPFENRYLLKQIPDFYERLKSSYDERFYQQEALGEYLSLAGGRVYHGFDRQLHVGEVRLDPTSRLLWGLDFNVDPMSSVVAQITGEDVLVIDEIVLSRAMTEQACREFHARYGGHRGGVTVYGDASGNHRQTTGSTDFQIVQEFFQRSGMKVSYRIPRSNPEVRDRVQLVNGKLRAASGEVHLRLDPRCRELIKDLEQVSYKENSVQIDKEKDWKRTHLSDALGYVLWQECRSKRTAGEQGKRLL